MRSLIILEELSEMNGGSLDEHHLPALYMLWPPACPVRPSSPALPAGYVLRSYVDGDDPLVRALLEIDGEGMSHRQWQDYRDKILPKGLFVISHHESKSLVATAGAVHNPNPGRFYFPSGGELGYLIVHPGHRGRRLGQIISARVVGRFLSAGYQCIRVGVQGWRHAAIKTYLNVGFLPFIHDESLWLRWERICEEIERPYTPDQWPQALSENY